MKNKLLFILLLLIGQISFAQDPTVGLLYHDTNVSDGYILFSPVKNNEVFLVNSCGEKVNQWTFTEAPGATCYLLNNGNLLRAGKDNLEIRDWNNNVVWTYATTSNGIDQHHDIEPLPNGNILCIATDSYTLEQMTAEGRNPANTAAIMKFERIVELQPIGTNSAAIVWEWKFNDHLIQDFDATKLNYGVVQNHPELLDINFNNGSLNDYIHSNGIDYNAALDQILISGRHLSEIYIIDHSTSTAQAASHSGGNSNKGGDFLWRWGNPQVYKQGTVADRKLFLQHCPLWVEEGYLDAGKISVFNNGETSTAQTFSSVVLIAPEITDNNYTMANNTFNPPTYDWSWSGNILGTELNQSKQSGTQSLPNGNMIICEAKSGRVSEITKTGTLLWSYKNPTGPIINSIPTYYNQFSVIPAEENALFKAEKYPGDFVGFTSVDLAPNGIIENVNSLSTSCNTLGVSNVNYQNIKILDPIKNNAIQFNETISIDNVTIYDVNGRVVFYQKYFLGNSIEVNLSPSLYFMKIKNDLESKNFKIIIQ